MKPQKFKTKDAWLEARKEYLTASDCAAILGLNPYKDPLEVYLEKVEGDSKPHYSDLLVDGLSLEPFIADRFRKEFNMNIKPAQFTLYPHTNGILAATPDYLIDDDALLEVKSVHPKRWQAFLESPPTHYIVQCIIQLACTNREVNHLYAWSYGEGTNCRKIARNLELEKQIVDTVVKWWNDFVVTKTPPISEKTPSGLVARAFKQYTEETIVLPESADELISTYKEISDEIKGLEERKDYIKSQLMQLMNQHTRATSGAGTVHWQRTYKSSVDSKRLEKEYPDVYRAVLKSDYYSALRIYPKKETV